MKATHHRTAHEVNNEMTTAATRLNYAVDLIISLLVPVQPYASDESGIVERELEKPMYNEWEQRFAENARTPTSPAAKFMHGIAGELERLSARLCLCKELRPMLDADLPPFAE